MHHRDRTQLEFGHGAEGGAAGETEAYGTYAPEFEGGGGYGAEEAEGDLDEVREMELAGELLEVTDEAELDHFLGKLVRAAAPLLRGATGKALQSLLRGTARQLLPVFGSMAGNLVAPGIGGVVGSRLASGAGSVLGLELEGLSREDQEFEAARQFVRFAADAARTAAGSDDGPESADLATEGSFEEYEGGYQDEFGYGADAGGELEGGQDAMYEGDFADEGEFGGGLPEYGQGELGEQLQVYGQGEFGEELQGYGQGEFGEELQGYGQGEFEAEFQGEFPSGSQGEFEGGSQGEFGDELQNYGQGEFQSGDFEGEFGSGDFESDGAGGFAAENAYETEGTDELDAGAARAAVLSAARRYAPGLVPLVSGAASAVHDPTAPPPYGGRRSTGRWVRRGRTIILLGI
ncbi:hypothetical protein DEJ45_02255 [Streptomyces venezuelae]|uniref:hypothetical protein n=1 Tax=Streptomyces venezuelae TaxID=54571 RepID=UPI00123D3445|nr:hypothetical protein [Streptomyces venezuelae]QES11354.1 hypothetical protein DEJ45_02255 [Streptomyces venezuelae]